MSKILFSEQLTPTPNPASGYIGLFADQADGHMKQIDSLGTVIDLAASGGGGSPGGSQYNIQTNDGAGGFYGDGNANWDYINHIFQLLDGGNYIALFQNDQTLLGGFSGGGFGNAIRINNSGSSFPYAPNPNTLEIIGNSATWQQFDYGNKKVTIGDVNGSNNNNLLSIDDANNSLFLGKTILGNPALGINMFTPGGSGSYVDGITLDIQSNYTDYYFGNAGSNGAQIENYQDTSGIFIGAYKSGQNYFYFNDFTGQRDALFGYQGGLTYNTFVQTLDQTSGRERAWDFHTSDVVLSSTTPTLGSPGDLDDVTIAPSIGGITETQSKTYTATAFSIGDGAQLNFTTSTGIVAIGETITGDMGSVGIIEDILSGNILTVKTTAGNWSSDTTFSTSGGATGTTVLTSPGANFDIFSFTDGSTTHWFTGFYSNAATIGGIEADMSSATGHTLGDSWVATLTVNQFIPATIDAKNNWSIFTDPTGTQGIFNGMNTGGVTSPIYLDGLTLDNTDYDNYTDYYVGSPLGHMFGARMEVYQDTSGEESGFNDNDFVLLDFNRNISDTYRTAKVGWSPYGLGGYGSMVTVDDVAKTITAQTTVYTNGATAYHGSGGLDDITIDGAFDGFTTFPPLYTLTCTSNNGAQVGYAVVTGTINVGDTVTGDMGSVGVIQFIDGGYIFLDVSSGNFTTDTTYLITAGTGTGGTGTLTDAGVNGLDLFDFTDGTTHLPIINIYLPDIQGIVPTLGSTSGHTLNDFWTMQVAANIAPMLSLSNDTFIYRMGDLNGYNHGTELNVNDAISTIQSIGGEAHQVANTNDNFVFQPADNLVELTVSGKTGTLPAIAGQVTGKQFTLKNTSGGTVTLANDGGDGSIIYNVGGAVSSVTLNDGESLTVVVNFAITKWLVI